MDNAERHLASRLLVTLVVRQCFPSITNAQFITLVRVLGMLATSV